MSLDLSKYTCLGQALATEMAKHANQVALIETDRMRCNGTWSYRQVGHEAKRISALLQDCGFERSDRLALVMSNQSKWVISALGGFWAGGILVPIDYKLTPAEALALLVHSKPTAVIVEWPIWKRWQSEDLRHLQTLSVFVTEAPKDIDLGHALRWETSPAGAFTYVSRLKDDVACIVYSSGTGGRPKGCMLTHANYLAQAQALGELFPVTHKDRYFSILPTNHAIDFMCGFLLSFFFGAGVVHQRTLRPEFLMHTIRTQKISHMALVPMLLKAFERELQKKLDETSWLTRRWIMLCTQLNKLATRTKPRYFISRILLSPIHKGFGGKLKIMFAGGAFVDPSTVQFFYDLGLPVAVGYGLTEAGTVLTVNDLKTFRADTVGKPIVNTTLVLRNKNANGEGEVWVKGPTVMAGYLEDPVLTQETIQDGWLRTGDVGTLDSTGHLKLVGRTKNMIVTQGGKNIYPEDLEGAFDTVSECSEHCVFAANYVWPSNELSDEKLLIVVRPKENVSTDALLESLRCRNQALADYKRLGGLIVWDKAFPRTASMKVKRDLLAKELGNTLNRDDVWETL